MMQRFGWVVVLMFLLLAAGCTPQATPTPTSSPTAEIPSANPKPTNAGLTRIATATPQVGASAVLPSDWQTIEWEGIRIPLPPQARWTTNTAPEGEQPAAPLVAQGAITYPASSALVERPFGPAFAIYDFAGTLEEWIEAEQQRSAQLVDPATIRATTVAGQPATVYQPTVMGTCDAGIYLLRLDATHLLRIQTNCLTSEPYATIIKQIELVR